MSSTLEWGPWEWQSTQFYSVKNNGYNSYYRFCDYIENVWPNSTNKVPGAWGVGLSKALDGYAKYVKEEVIPGCTCPFCSHHLNRLLIDFLSQSASPPATPNSPASTTRPASRTKTAPAPSTTT
jgi:hypothetical protein